MERCRFCYRDSCSLFLFDCSDNLFLSNRSDFLFDFNGDFLFWWFANFNDLYLRPFFLERLHLLNKPVHQGFVFIRESVVADHLLNVFLNLTENCVASLGFGGFDDLQYLLKEGVIHLGIVNSIEILPLSILNFDQPCRQSLGNS